MMMLFDTFLSLSSNENIFLSITLNFRSNPCDPVAGHQDVHVVVLLHDTYKAILGTHAVLMSSRNDRDPDPKAYKTRDKNAHSSSLRAAERVQTLFELVFLEADKNFVHYHGRVTWRWVAGVKRPV